MNLEKSQVSEMIRKMIETMNIAEVRETIGKEFGHIALVSEPEDLKKLIEKFIKYPNTETIIRNKWKNIYCNSQNGVELLELFAKDEETRKNILDNISFLISYGDCEDTGILCKYLGSIEGAEDVITEKFQELWYFCIDNAHNIIIPMLKTEKGRKIVKEKFETIKDKFFPDSRFGTLNIKGFFKVVNSIKNIEGFEEEYEKYGFWADLYEQIKIPKLKIEPGDITSILKMTPKEQRKALSDSMATEAKELEFVNFIYSKDREEKRMILEEVAQGNPYKYKSCGSSSLIIQTGDKIVKIGAGRRKFKIPYHPRIMMPYFRKEYSDESCLEVYNYGNCESADITDEKLLEIYKELEKDGIIWSDARKENLLVLKEDNVIPEYIKSEEFNIFGFLENEKYPTNNHKVLKKGDIVICDLDMLYLKDDPDFEDGIKDDIVIKYIRLQKNKSRERDD